MKYSEISAEEAALNGMSVAVYAATRPDDPAVADQYGRKFSWHELNAAANQLARLFRDLGLSTGDGVALLSSNRAEFALVIAACMRSGVRLTPINWHLTGEEVGYILDNCDAQVFITEQRFAEAALEAVTHTDKLKACLSCDGDLSGFDNLAEAVASHSADNLADPVHGNWMLYTSGTTGRPKGVHVKERPPNMPDPDRSHTFDTVALCTGPAYHAAPLAIDVVATIVSGGKLVLMDRFDPELTLHLIHDHRVTHTHMVAPMFHRMLQLDEATRSNYDVSSLRRVVHGAAPCPVHVKHAMIEWFGPVLLEYYAATEGGGGFLIDSEEWLRKPGSVGCPGPEFDNRILDDEGNDVPAGETGTIYMRAPDRVGRFEYYKDSEKTASSYRGEYFTLGDMGYFDEDGYLFLTGRTAELIISGGVNIYPQDVDTVIMQHHAVHEVCTIGVPNDEWGEEVKSVVQLNPGIEPGETIAEDIIAFAREHIAHYKCPRTIDFADNLPRLPTGKIQRRVVRDPYWAGRDKSI